MRKPTVSSVTRRRTGFSSAPTANLGFIPRLTISDLSHLPAGYHSVTPYLLTAEVGKLLEFILEAFDAETTEQVEMPDSTMLTPRGRSAIRASCRDRLADGAPRCGRCFILYVPHCDAAYEGNRRQGRRKVMEPMDRFYGDRSGEVLDPFGNQWWFGTRNEGISSEELAKRMC